MAKLKKRAPQVVLSSSGALFMEGMARELQRIEKKGYVIHSCHEAYAVLEEEVDEVKAVVWKKRENRDLKELRLELMQVATNAMRMCQYIDETPKPL
jgi:hypothetical protein